VSTEAPSDDRPQQPGEKEMNGDSLANSPLVSSREKSCGKCSGNENDSPSSLRSTLHEAERASGHTYTGHRRSELAGTAAVAARTSRPSQPLSSLLSFFFFYVHAPTPTNSDNIRARTLSRVHSRVKQDGRYTRKFALRSG